jgi:hypothetical protein
MAKRKVGEMTENAWKPEPGDSLGGKVLRKSEVTTEFGKCGVLEIEDKTNGVTSVFCGSAVLSRVYDDVEVGEILDLTYEGEKKSEKTGRFFKSYLAEVDDGKK